MYDSVQVDSIASTALSPQHIDEGEDGVVEGRSDGLGLGLGSNTGVASMAGKKDDRLSRGGSYDAEIWRPVKEESLLDLKTKDADSIES